MMVNWHEGVVKVVGGRPDGPKKTNAARSFLRGVRLLTCLPLAMLPGPPFPGWSWRRPAARTGGGRFPSPEVVLLECSVFSGMKFVVYTPRAGVGRGCSGGRNVATRIVAAGLRIIWVRGAPHP